MRSRAPWIVVGVAALAGIAVVAATPPSSSSSPLDLSKAKVVDLTHAFDEKTIYWPNSPSTFKLQKLADGATEGGYYYRMNSFCAPEHGGTHLDAPSHFAKDGWTADQIPLGRLVARGVVIDVTKQAAADLDYRLTAADLRAWEAKHGAVAAGSIVLLRTGWGSRWPDRKKYLGDDTPGETSNLHFPSFGKESAEILVRERKVAAMGLDTASIDYGPSKDFIVHQIANGANVPGLENLANLDQVPETGAWIVALPMKIAGGSGGPLRAIALIP
ncbi:MAG TPA: cyclase family protein [Thermoanaerobaculia bacterium]|jgi:kynurenine formamidase|nr:cyclase family protein [Thermoanaerobaculia bacterium]